MDRRQATLYVKTGTHVLFRGAAAYALIPP